MEIDSKTFCILPFIHMATKTDGDLKLCCRSWPVGNIKDNSIEELWNSDTYKRIRKQLLSGERAPECAACWRHEDIDVTSMRQRVNKVRKEYFTVLDNLNEDYSMPFEIPILEAKLSNFCNLKCRMCHPLDSTSWREDWQEIQHLMPNANTSTYEKVLKYDLANKPYVSAFDNNDKFWEEFDRMIPYFDLIEFAGGEPLIDPIHYKILHKLKEYGKNISLKYSTNCTILEYKKDNVLELWDHFKNINVMVSIDGINDIYNYIRQLSDYENVKNNIKKISSHHKVNHFGAAITLQVYNSFIIPQMCDEFVEECNMHIHMHRVNYPTFLDCRIIPKNVKDIIIHELSMYYDSVDSKTHLNWTDDRKSVTKRHIKDAIAMFNGGDLSKEIPNFIEFSDTLDKVQNVKYNWRRLLPMLAREIDGR